jgi:small basic protein
MKRLVIGVVLAAVALYAWGFLVWGAGPYATLIWKQAKDHEVAGQMLREQFPENGTYFVPAATQENVEQRFEQGPVAMVHMLRVDGRPAFDPSIMVQGFFVNLVVIVLVALLLKQVASALPTYLDRVKFVALAGLASAILIDIGDCAWWQMDWGWMAYRGAYHTTAWVVMGLVLGCFLGKPTDEPKT